MLPISTILSKVNPLERGNVALDEFYLSLVVTDKKVKSGIWSSGSAGAINLSFGSTENWGGESAEELIVAADASIASAVAKLSQIEAKQPSKVILGLPDHWLEQSTIQGKKSAFLQSVCRKLLLKPMGFVVTAEAIAHLFKHEEGGLPSVILVNVEEGEIIVSLINQGKFLGSKLVGRSDSLALDLEEGLLRFNFDGFLPNRIVLIPDEDIENLEEVKQALVAYPWVGPENEKKLNFLQLPKVEIALGDLEVRATVFDGNRELGYGAKIETKIETEVEREEKIEVVAEKEEKKPEEEVILTAEELPASDFGFIAEQDILQVSPPSTEQEESKPESLSLSPTKLSLAQPEKIEPNKSFWQKGKKAIVGLGWRLRKLLPGRKGPKSEKLVVVPLAPSRMSLPRLGVLRYLLFSVLGLAIIFLFGLALFWRMAAAEVKIFVRPETVEKEFDFIVLAKTEGVNEEKMIIPAQEVTIELNDNKTANVLGKKIVGDKATGDVVIYNRTEQTKAVSKETLITGPAGLRFLLGQEVKVASKTADLQAGVDKWGEVRVPVVAEKIGPQYNLAANTNLQFASLPPSSLLVKNPGAFSGGTSREIQAVSKEDRENLQKTLFKELESKAREEIGRKLSAGDHLLVDSLSLKNKTDHFDHEVDDEASSLTLSEKALFSALFFKEDDFKILLEKVISGLIPKGYQPKPSAGEANFSLQDAQKGLYRAKVKEEFLPEIKTSDLSTALKGKSFVKGEAYLKNLGEIQGIEILIRPSFFSHLRYFPLKEGNIVVKLEKSK